MELSTYQPTPNARNAFQCDQLEAQHYATDTDGRSSRVVLASLKHAAKIGDARAEYPGTSATHTQ